MWAGIVAALKALPALLAALKGLLSLWKQIREAAEAKEDERKLKDETDSILDGGRPSGN